MGCFIIEIFLVNAEGNDINRCLVQIIGAGPEKKLYLTVFLEESGHR